MQCVNYYVTETAEGRWIVLKETIDTENLRVLNTRDYFAPMTFSEQFAMHMAQSMNEEAYQCRDHAAFYWKEAS